MQCRYLLVLDSDDVCERGVDELWVRTEERFQEGFVDALSSATDPQQRCVAAALSVVAWCREHPVEAQVLLAGPDELGLEDWPGPLTGRRERLQRKLRKMLNDIPADAGRVSAALIDVPHAVVRRHLRARQPVPAGADAILADCARALISPS